jgi:hypothetical protein
MTTPEPPDRKPPPLPSAGETRLPEVDEAPPGWNEQRVARPQERESAPGMHWALKIVIGIASVIGGGVLLVGVAILVVLGSCMLGR